MTTALVRRPSPRLAEGLLTHLERTVVDYRLALDQWHGYVSAIENNGWKVDYAEPADDCPDSVFIEDSVVIFGDLAVVTRPGAESRRPETASTET
ncbi:MAG: N(G),N(G)-dimethylarginine dimethylaminohydrolase, partial [Acidimicrobiia bacterium]